ncbi:MULTISPECIES: hypothetical protein [unclassified Sinorhizobium]|uniref:hypothetical protein n=1 Tax=unclassified Sinorhizobium TaxID=2613772 RepID=UPI003525CE10
MIIKEGTILAFSSGSYSDKWTSGPFNVLKEIDQKDVVDAFKAQFVPEYEWDDPSESEFITWLSANGYIKDVAQFYNWYTGNYGFNPIIA